MAAVFVFLLAIFGDVFVSSKFFVNFGYYDYKYNELLVNEFNSKFGRFRFPRSLFAFIAIVPAIIYEFIPHVIFVILILSFIVVWFFLSLRDAMRAKSWVDDMKKTLD